MKLALTERRIAGLKPAAVRVEYSDCSVHRIPGFMLAVSPTGRKYFSVAYRLNGRQRRHALGEFGPYGVTLAEARDAAYQVIAAAKRGDDPAPVRQSGGPSFTDIAREYVTRWSSVRNKSWKEDDRIIEREVIPVIGQLPAGSVTKADIRRVLDGIVNRPAPQTANKALSVCHRIFTWAVEQDILTANPAHGIRPPAKVETRDRVLSDGEIRQIWTASESLKHPVGYGFQLMLLTGQRKSEVLEARWDEFDFDAALWTIPAARSKNGLAHRVPLAEPAIRILERLKDGQPADSTHVIPHPAHRGQPFGNPQVYVRKVRRITGIKDRWTLHDFRRTAATGLAALKVAPVTISKVLNHTTGGSVTMRVYVRHSFDDEKRQALTDWARSLMRTVSGIRAVNGAS